MRSRKLIGTAVVAIAIPTAIAVTMLPSEAATAPVNGGVYQLASAASGKCVDVTGASADNSALLVQSACTTGARHQCKVQGSGPANLVNANSTRCIDVPSSSTNSGLQLQQYGCGDGTKTNQLWTFSASGAASGKYLVKSAATGLCLSNKDGSTAGNNPIVQETCSDISRMQWSFNYVSGPTSPPRPAADGPTPPTGSRRAPPAARAAPRSPSPPSPTW